MKSIDHLLSDLRMSRSLPPDSQEIFAADSGVSDSFIGFNLYSVTAHAKKNANPKPTSYCGRYVYNALRAGGLPLPPNVNSAKDMGPILTSVGYRRIAQSPFDLETYRPLIGDVVIWNASSESRHGHVQIWVPNAGWVSDFVQLTIYPHSGKAKPWLQAGFSIYRHIKILS